MKLTEKKYTELTRELRVVKDLLEESLAEQEAAAAAGDLRENEEYSTARANSERLNNRKRELEYILSEVEIVPADNSPSIVLGSVIDVTKVTEAGEPLGETRRFTLETEGDTILAGVIGIESPLGREILNGTSGVYFVHSNGGIYYRVDKVLSA